MTILFVTGHPAQIHNFRIVKKLLEEVGHQVFWASTNKDISYELLDIYKIEYFKLERPKGGKIAKIINLFSNAKIISKIIKQKKIDMVVSRISPYASIACKLHNIKHIGLADTEVSGIYDSIFSKFLDSIITSETFERTLSSKQIRIPSNIELFYLHSNHFKADNTIYKDLNLEQNEPFVIIRFINWSAYHDFGHKGFLEEQRSHLIEILKKRIKVFISCEGQLHPKLEKYRINLPLEKMHSALSYASLYIGEGASMAAEAAVLGTPSIFVNTIYSGNGKDLEKFGLLFQYGSTENQIEKILLKSIEIIEQPKKIFESAKINYMKSKIDAASFLSWFIQNYPSSRDELHEFQNQEFYFNKWR